MPRNCVLKLTGMQKQSRHLKFNALLSIFKLFWGKNSNSNIMRKKWHGANGADGGNVRTLTVAEERGRTETMDDGQGLERGKRGEGIETGKQWKLNSEGLGWQRQNEWQPRLPMVGIA